MAAGIPKGVSCWTPLVGVYGGETPDQHNLFDGKERNCNGNVHTEKDGEGNLTQYEYDSQGRMIGRIDPSGRRTGYVLDARGQTVAEVVVDGDSTRYVFDANGNQVMKVNANGAIVLYGN